MRARADKLLLCTATPSDGSCIFGPAMCPHPSVRKLSANYSDGHSYQAGRDAGGRLSADRAPALSGGRRALPPRGSP